MEKPGPTGASTTDDARINSAWLQRMQDDPLAPRYHFIAPEGNAVPFDPNGALFWQGRYHLFYIFQDPDLPHGGHCWGHASSADLVHWQIHPPALVPRPGDPETGIFSGGAFINRDGIPTLIYHGVHAGTCIATAEDPDLITWRKNPHNPVIPEPTPGDPGWGVYNVFDPHAWVEGDMTYAILGGQVKPHDLYDTAYLFRSPDLVHWEYLRPFYNPNPHWTSEEEDCACPDFFRLGDRHILMCISHARGARFYVGDYRLGTFVPEAHYRLNWPGGSCFAPESLQDDQGRRIFWAWVPGQGKRAGLVPQELGVMTLPRVLSCDAQGALHIAPAPELTVLRGEARSVVGMTVQAGETMPLPTIHGDALEIELEAQVTPDARAGLYVRADPDGAERTAIVVDRRAGTLTIDTRQASLSSEVFQRYPIARGTPRDVRQQTAPFELASDGVLRLRIFIDRSILEVYTGGVLCMTQRIYPTLPTSTGTALFSERGALHLTRLTAWPMAAIYEA